jgi:hypothetical protein
MRFKVSTGHYVPRLPYTEKEEKVFDTLEEAVAYANHIAHFAGYYVVGRWDANNCYCYTPVED